MSVPLAGTTAVGSGFPGAVGGDLSRIQSQREQLTFHLRTLATDLDALDRRMSDLDWRLRRQPRDVAGSEMSSERNVLAAQRSHLTTRLRDMARELNDLDVALASWPGAAPVRAPRVGTCPDCGYPSLESGLCAFCRPRMAR